MTAQPRIKTDLEQLRALKLEEADLISRIQRTERLLDVLRNNETADVVTLGKKNSRSLGRITIEGTPDARLSKAIRAKDDLLDKLLACRLDIHARVTAAEEEIETCQDSFIRLMLRLRYVDGLSWDMIAARTGGYNTADNCKQIVRRYFRKQ